MSNLPARLMALIVLVLVPAVICCASDSSDDHAMTESDSMATSYDDIEIDPAEPTFTLTEQEWRERLTEDEYHILREHGTEPAFSGELLDNEQHGTYHCAGCGHPLFSSETKFKSGTGWPSYWEPLGDDAIGTQEDHSLGQTRIEVHCGRCASHLGHVFIDGPEPTGLRYCINSLALDFDPN